MRLSSRNAGTNHSEMRTPSFSGATIAGRGSLRQAKSGLLSSPMMSEAWSENGPTFPAIHTAMKVGLVLRDDVDFHTSVLRLSFGRVVVGHGLRLAKTLDLQ